MNNGAKRRTQPCTHTHTRAHWDVTQGKETHKRMHPIKLDDKWYKKKAMQRERERESEKSVDIT